MNCLHICNDYLGSKVHDNLYKNLKTLHIQQTIYHPLRKHNISKTCLNKDNLVEDIIISKVLHSSHPLFFKKKINFLFKDMSSKLDLKTFDIVHATTLFSDGALALKIYLEYKTPYIVAIRGTDINLFLKYRLDLYPLAKKIIENAKKIIFISNSLKFNFNHSFFAKILNSTYQKKISVIPNGIDSYWLQNIKAKSNIDKPKNFLYVGKFDKNKNVLKLIDAFLQFASENDYTLNLVGKGGAQETKIKELSYKFPSKIVFHGPIYDKVELEKVYQSNDIFAMISISETFGLVYVESLTQGLPILFTQNQGIDGTFQENIGLSVDPKSIGSIKKAMEHMVVNYNNFQLNKVDLSRFSWTEIAKKYKILYQGLIN